MEGLGGFGGDAGGDAIHRVPTSWMGLFGLLDFGVGAGDEADGQGCGGMVGGIGGVGLYGVVEEAEGGGGLGV